MPSKWPIYKLADLCQSIDYGYTASASDIPSGPKFLRITDIVSGHVDWDTVPYCEIDQATVPKFRLHDGDVVIARTGATTGYSVYIANPPDAVFASYLVRLKLAPGVNPRFISYFLKSPRFWEYIRGVLGDKSAQPNASAKTMTQVTLALPSPEKQQQAIAYILATLDDKIDLNRRMNRILEAMAQAIFKSWFVNFDPVRSKAAGKQPSCLPPHLADLFSDDFENSRLGEVPKGWSPSNLGAHFRLTMGQSPPGSTYNETGYGLPFYQGRSDFGFRFPSRRVFCSAPTRLAEPGDTLVSVRAPVGDVNMANEKCAVGRGVAAIRHNTGSRSFTYYVLYNLGDHFGKFEAEGTVFGSINKMDFERLPFIAPPTKLLDAFDRTVLPFDDRIEFNEQQLSTLTALRNALLPKLISGELRVADAERIVRRCA